MQRLMKSSLRTALALIAIAALPALAGTPPSPPDQDLDLAPLGCLDSPVSSDVEPLAATLDLGVDQSTDLEPSFGYDPINLCTPASKCCKICSKGKACGNSCISANYNCHQPKGCACNSVDVCSD